MRNKERMVNRLPEYMNPETIKRKLMDEQVYVSVRGEFVRVAPHVYNNSEDLEKLAELL